jgi:hypothetical protein
MLFSASYFLLGVILVGCSIRISDAVSRVAKAALEMEAARATETRPIHAMKLQPARTEFQGSERTGDHA